MRCKQTNIIIKSIKNTVENWQTARLGTYSENSLGIICEIIDKGKMSSEIILPATKRFKKIPIYVVEEHSDALQFIYSAIGGKKLPLEGTTLLHLDAHPDMLIDRKLKGAEARAGRKLLPLLQIENWIVPAVAAGHLSRVVWLRPPWATQLADGTRHLRVGDQPNTGLLRVDSIEPYFLSDALFSAELINDRKFTLTVAELYHEPIEKSGRNRIENLANSLEINEPYVLDIDLDFFSTGNPFLGIYGNIGLYDRLEPIFSFKLPENNDVETVAKVVENRERQIVELENLFQCLEEQDSLENYKGDKTELYEMVADLAKSVTSEAEKSGETLDWWVIYAGGCTRDQGGLPHHISTEEEIHNLVEKGLKLLIEKLPPPVLITVARSTDDGYCPSDQVELIQSLVLKTLKEVFNTDDPELHYLTVNTG